MSRWSGRRGQTEPLAALAAVLVLGLALSLYAGTLEAVTPGQSPSGVAPATLSEVHDAASDGAVVLPDRIAEASTAGAAGYAVNVSLAAAGERWTAGPVPPATAESAVRAVSVRLDRWTVRPGRLRVVVWT